MEGPMSRRLLVPFVVALSALGVHSRAAETPEDLAERAADSWLELVDQGKYGDSWTQAAKLFKGAVSKEQWQQAVGGVRKPLGELVSRKIRSKQFVEELPGAPDGKYVVIQYDAAFQNKASAIETITPMLDPDGTWRVSGYFIN
jgi:hypothetical protein